MMSRWTTCRTKAPLRTRYSPNICGPWNEDYRALKKPLTPTTGGGGINRRPLDLPESMPGVEVLTSPPESRRPTRGTLPKSRRMTRTPGLERRATSLFDQERACSYFLMTLSH